MVRKATKTNAMRILERMGIAFEHQEYECTEFVDGSSVATRLGLAHEEVFKTLVTVASDGEHYVFVIPVDDELDLKKCARSVEAKAVQMIAMKGLFEITGYVRGGCTAIGMKRQFVTRIDETAQLFDQIYISGGRIGSQIKLAPDDFCTATGAKYANLTLGQEDRSSNFANKLGV